VHVLRDRVEQTPLANNPDGLEEPHEILRESPVIGDGKFKLEIGRVLRQNRKCTDMNANMSF
jgi:hypothetical protein